MKSKKLGFAIIAIIILLSVPPMALGGSDGYLVPVKIKKMDRAEIKGYIVLHGEEILRMGSCECLHRRKGSQRIVALGGSRGERMAPSKMLEFHRITFYEGGNEVSITYGSAKEPVVSKNFFSRKGIHFTTNASNPDVLPQFLAPRQIRWIERTGRPSKIR